MKKRSKKKIVRRASEWSRNESEKFLKAIGRTRVRNSIKRFSKRMT